MALIVLVAGAIIAVSTLTDDGTGTTGEAPSASPPSADSTAPQALPTTVPTTAPSGVRWELAGQLPVPVSVAAGPKTVTDTTASGYAHTPEGALIAAGQILMRSSLGREYWKPTIERQFVPSADRDRLLAEMGTVDDSSVDYGAVSKIAGFSYQSYTPDTAVIGLVLRAPSAGAPQYHVLSLTLLWRDGDWRMQAPPGGAWISVNRRTNDLTGVVEWGPQ
ncbi:hypothetical protein ACQP2H_31905 (plasmid) [Micromonospora sp. CA-248260]|uniref:hypothetical protein n=1 Tax=Micromonospora sp. CA-248260 TaxID=3239962 RepID=UPI003D94EEC2